MDLVYLTESYAFESMRAPPLQEKYSMGWNDYTPENQSTYGKNYPKKSDSKVDKQHCRLCQEKSKKALSNYIRQKSSCTSNDCITEEEES